MEPKYIVKSRRESVGYKAAFGAALLTAALGAACASDTIRIPKDEYTTLSTKAAQYSANQVQIARDEREARERAEVARKADEERARRAEEARLKRQHDQEAALLSLPPRFQVGETYRGPIERREKPDEGSNTLWAIGYGLLAAGLAYLGLRGLRRGEPDPEGEAGPTDPIDEPTPDPAPA